MSQLIGELVSKQAVDTLVDELARAISDERCFMPRGRSTATIMQDILDLPSVNPQGPKTGNWEQYGYPWEDKFKCSECGEKQPKILCGERIIGDWSDYCPNCGCRMVEPQESEDEEDV